VSNQSGQGTSLKRGTAEKNPLEVNATIEVEGVYINPLGIPQLGRSGHGWRSTSTREQRKAPKRTLKTRKTKKPEQR